jgi:hypothetical protein
MVILPSNSSVCLACPGWSGVGLELEGLGFTVPVLLPGMACLSAPSLLLRGGPGAAPKGGAESECAQWSPESCWWSGYAATGWWGCRPHCETTLGCVCVWYVFTCVGPYFVSFKFGLGREQKSPAESSVCCVEH